MASMLREIFVEGCDVEKPASVCGVVGTARANAELA
jgi:hypothetical protein